VVRGLLADVAALRLLRRDVVEARILDEVKMLHRLVTAELFERRLRLFCREVDRLTLAFQPIVALDGRGVVGWEALARHDGRAPAALFDAAELWGNRFCTELDVRVLDKAADAFALHRVRRGEWPEELSVNCWPSSLAEDDFVAELQELHASGAMPASRLCLEISERSDIGRATGWTPDEFRSRLRAIRRQTGVSFAVDDFGVQHANIARLQDLDLSHVKIDKQLLYHEYARSTIEYVVGVADRHLGGDLTVVVEGWEDDCPLGLAELRALGVGAVQGFGIRRPQDGFPPLGPTELAVLAERLGSTGSGAVTVRP
jgi:EAL domain-containing protein (putative c-di-GMP-specific phosphodiesterase class I)